MLRIVDVCGAYEDSYDERKVSRQLKSEKKKLLAQ